MEQLVVQVHIRKLKEIKIDQKQGQRFIEKLIADVLKLNQTDSTAMRLHWQRPDTGIEREGKVGLVLFGQRGTVDDHVGKIDTLATAQRATHLDHGVETVGIDLRHP